MHSFSQKWLKKQIEVIKKRRIIVFVNKLMKIILTGTFLNKINEKDTTKELKRSLVLQKVIRSIMQVNSREIFNKHVTQLIPSSLSYETKSSIFHISDQDKKF